MLKNAGPVRQVSAQHSDLCPRDRKLTRDFEDHVLGNLITDFNTMLDEIQSRDDELRVNRSQLEERVMQRTRELEIANSKLATSKEQAEAVANRMQYHAHHDALTGLPNRALLMDRLRRATALANRRQDFTVAVIFLDLDRFKLINESLGHDLGEKILVQVARQLETCMPQGDTVARVGGDKFAVLLEGPSLEPAQNRVIFPSELLRVSENVHACKDLVHGASAAFFPRVESAVPLVLVI